MFLLENMNNYLSIISSYPFLSGALMFGVVRVKNAIC